LRTQRKLVETRVQYATLPYGRNGGARAEVMLVALGETRRWIIPKGWPHKGRTPHRSAAREAYEEAGGVGRDPLGSFSYEKPLPSGGTGGCGYM
jgi:8-oxo-dGTP pyrophosphatase MutT (NUDIX family)